MAENQAEAYLAARDQMFELAKQIERQSLELSVRLRQPASPRILQQQVTPERVETAKDFMRLAYMCLRSAGTAFGHEAAAAAAAAEGTKSGQ